MKLKDWLKTNRSFFNDSDLRFLIKNVFNLNYSEVLGSDVYIDLQNLQYLDEIKELCINGLPLAYIFGKEEFFGLEFRVDRNTLIPRPETELIAERAIEIIRKNNLKSVLDLGCGSGNIAISVKKEVSSDVAVFASDVSFYATEVTRDNAESNQVDISIVNADLLEGFKINSFDLIISNPPYVESDHIKGSLLFEPKVALDGGIDGLDVISKILEEAHHYIKDKGYLIIEVGYQHKQAADKLIESKACFYKLEEWIKDYSDIFRGFILSVIGDR
ncbi:MAG: peptide chain release factor N(5)-glutamine methyltransferase [Candidatus Omnitrophica bacterium]|nr:peptide chain release factor N(5)-glutamine methyltransferase [Candidatus Omnitrophota bacterium]